MKYWLILYFNALDWPRIAKAQELAEQFLSILANKESENKRKRRVRRSGRYKGSGFAHLTVYSKST